MSTESFRLLARLQCGLRHLVPLVWGIVFIAALQDAQLIAGDVAASRPNIVIIMIDDLQADGLASLGDPVAKTPNLDTLVEQGFVFRNAYTMGSHIPAVCLPSRHQFLTGKHLFNLGQSRLRSPADESTLPAVFKRAGYYTVHSGKHNNSPQQIHLQFDQTTDEAGTGYTAAQHVDRILDAIEHHESPQPLLVYLAASEPHDPQYATEDLYSQYRADEIALPDTFLPHHPFDNGEMTVRDELTLAFPRTPDAVKGKLARYYASVAYLDSQLGRLINALKAAKQYDNTVFVILGDNGLSLGRHGLLGKQNLYEFGGMHIPLIFSGPGIPQGETSALVYGFDVFPTLTSLVGISIPESVNGHDLLPIIRGDEDEVRPYLLTAYKDVQRAVRDNRWKLIRYPHVDQTQLFDLENDPHETRNLIEEPAYTVHAQQLLRVLASLQAELGDAAPLFVDAPQSADWSYDSPHVHDAIKAFQQKYPDVGKVHQIAPRR